MVESTILERMMEEVMAAQSDGAEDDLVRELLDDGSSLVILPEEANFPNTRSSSEQAINRFICNIYSGPTITDIENALSVTNQGEHFQELSSDRISILERELSKIENKYTIKIKCFGNGMGEDGYKWRKYGRKSIKNSPNPRTYYRCTNPRCSAKKQVERSNEDPDTLIITYEGLHLHFAYPYIMSQTQQSHSHPTKKSKTAFSHAQAQEYKAQQAQHVHQSPDARADVTAGLTSSTFMDSPQGLAQESVGPQGLLEDMVPLMIRNPTNNGAHSNFSCSSCPSPPTSPPPPPPLSWLSNYSASCYTVGLNSII